MKERIVLVGAGPLGINAAHIAKLQGTFEVAGFVDSKTGEVAGYPVLGDDSALERLRASGIRNAVVCIGDATKRIAVSAELKNKGFAIPPLIHPSADVGIGAEIGEGAILFHTAFVGPQAVIGAYCVIEAGAFVGHNAVLQEGVLLSARTVVGNHAAIGRGTTLKLGSGCANRVRIGERCVVAEFRNLIEDVSDNTEVAHG